MTTSHEPPRFDAICQNIFDKVLPCYIDPSVRKVCSVLRLTCINPLVPGVH